MHRRMNTRQNQPSHIDFGSKQYDRTREGPTSPRDLPSPRSGEIPPALSPLDAFALRGRILAQRLEAGNGNGRRMSRLPPLTIADALAQPRAGYFGAAPPSTMSETNPSPNSAGTDGSTTAQVSQQHHRPQSQYPSIQAFDDVESIVDRDPTIPTIKPVQEEGEEQHQDDFASKHSIGNDYFAARVQDRPSSPEILPVQKEILVQRPDRPTAKKQSTIDSMESTHSSSSRGLAPTKSPARARSPRFPKEKPSIRTVDVDGSDESDPLSALYGRNTLARNPSFGSGYSRPRSPFSPIFALPRSPSMSSDYSLQPRASVNFSRPLSRNGRPSFETQRSFDDSNRSLRHDSPPLRPSLDVLSLSDSMMDSPRLPSLPWIDAGEPLCLTDDDLTRPNTPSGAAPSTIVVSLPRGRPLPKDTAHSHSDLVNRSGSLASAHDLGSRGLSQLDDALITSQRRDRTQTGGLMYTQSTASVPALGPLVRTFSADDSILPPRTIKGHRSNPSFPPASASIISESSSARTLPAFQPLQPIQPRQPPPRFVSSSSDKSSEASFATHLPRSPRIPSGSLDPQLLNDSLAQLTPEGHLAKGLALHEDGEVQKSTYHLRLAAKGGEPTGMLMYALACRHGWGMRPNQAEGVSWLRKAVDSSGLVVAGDEVPESGDSDQGSNTQRRGSAIVAAKRHKAQLALAIYELGQSYMNGWGIKTDKSLALRCYELAGSWDDGDALVEAGFCYAKGLGCKKDLKKAAEYYRRADKMGMSMAGQSW